MDKKWAKMTEKCYFRIEKWGKNGLKNGQKWSILGQKMPFFSEK